MYQEDFSNENLLNLAKKYGTPLYVYSMAKIQANIKNIEEPFNKIFDKNLICYAIKANSNRNFIKNFSERGLGFDAVSGGDLLKILSVQKDLSNTIYSGTAKTRDELKIAIQNNILMVLCESPSEIVVLGELAEELNTPVSMGIRINPALDPRTHRHINTSSEDTKFGISTEILLPHVEYATKHKYLNFKGISCHIGSMIEHAEDYFLMADVIEEQLQLLKDNDISLEYVSFGGGFAITYTNEKNIDLNVLFTYYKKVLSNYPEITPLIEPGRAIVGNAGVLLGEITYIKEQAGYNFLFTDAGMTELIRPALYDAIHNISNISPQTEETREYIVGGPICESTDVFSNSTYLSCKEGDVLSIENAGAYSKTMASNYNTRPYAPEVLMVEGEDLLISKRQDVQDIWRDEIICL